jgi:hypothetical protein
MQLVEQQPPRLWTPGKCPGAILERGALEDVLRCAPLAGFSFGAGRASKKVVATFDPTTSDPAGWWRASFSGVPWTPTASAGTSGSNGNLTQALTPPTTGTAVNGFTPALFDGTNDWLGLATASATDVMNASDMTFFGLFKVTSAVAATSNFYDDEPMMGASNGNHALVFTSSGVRAGVFDTASRQTTSIATSTGIWFMAAGRVDKSGTGTVKCRVSAAGTTTDATPVSIPGTPAALGSDMWIGKNYASAAFLAFEALEIVTYKRVLSDAELTDWKTYFNSRYALSL